MACPVIHTGEQFLAGALAHIDCQAQTIGAYGFGALADPTSPTSLALGSLLAVFIALFGIRLLLGFPLEGRDVVTAAIKVGIVLTLATSWPAWRVLGYDLVIAGPAQLANTIGLAAGLPGAGGALTDRLQGVDAAIASLNAYGSGRLGVASGDWFQLGFARSAYLTGTLGPLALVRLTGGILLAIAPLMAGLLLFGVTRSLFIGWTKALAMVFLSSLALALVLGTELALLEPWLQDALQKRAADQQILEAPTEILVMTLAFALIAFGVLAITARLAFHPDALIARFVRPGPPAQEHRQVNREAPLHHLESREDTPMRAQRVAMAVGESLRREERMLEAHRLIEAAPSGNANVAAPGETTSPSGRGSDALGASYRRTSRRISNAGQRRDRTI